MNDPRATGAPPRLRTWAEVAAEVVRKHGGHCSREHARRIADRAMAKVRAELLRRLSP
jgi:hypothetical protein